MCACRAGLSKGAKASLAAAAAESAASYSLSSDNIRKAAEPAGPQPGDTSAAAAAAATRQKRPADWGQFK